MENRLEIDYHWDRYAVYDLLGGGHYVSQSTTSLIDAIEFALGLQETVYVVFLESWYNRASWNAQKKGLMANGYN